MKKHLIFAAGFFLGVCCSVLSFSLQNANAQNSVEETVGAPDSSNAVIIEQTYGITETAPVSQNTSTNEDMEPLPGSPGVDVAPLPDKSEEPKTHPTSNNNEPSDANIEIDEIIEAE